MVHLGANACIVGRNVEKTESMAQSLMTARPGSKVLGIGAVDVRSPESLNQAVETCVKELGGIDYCMYVLSTIQFHSIPFHPIPHKSLPNQLTHLPAPAPPALPLPAHCASVARWRSRAWPRRLRGRRADGECRCLVCLFRRAGGPVWEV